MANALRSKIKSPKISGALRIGIYGYAVMLILLSNVAMAAEEAHGEASAGLPQFDPSTYPSQIFWLFVSFAILYAFFSTKTLPDLSSVLENRRNHVEGDLATAEKLRAEAEASQKAYEDSLNAARTQSTKALSDAQEKIREMELSENKRFSEKSEHEIKALEVRLSNAKETAMEEMNTIAAEVARDAAEKIVGISTDLKNAKTVVKSLSGKEAA